MCGDFSEKTASVLLSLALATVRDCDSCVAMRTVAGKYSAPVPPYIASSSSDGSDSTSAHVEVSNGERSSSVTFFCALLDTTVGSHSSSSAL